MMGRNHGCKFTDGLLDGFVAMADCFGFSIILIPPFILLSQRKHLDRQLWEQVPTSGRWLKIMI